jgi:hypothetical protein
MSSTAAAGVGQLALQAPCNVYLNACLSCPSVCRVYGWLVVVANFRCHLSATNQVQQVEMCLDSRVINAASAHNQGIYKSKTCSLESYKLTVLSIVRSCGCDWCTELVLVSRYPCISMHLFTFYFVLQFLPSTL